jgi:ABC-type antimicrobial peptide transport system permease subunit
MTKATLTGGQVGAAFLAGIFGHLLFAAGWIILGVTLLGGTIAAILGGTLQSIGDGAEIFGTAGGVLGGIVLGFLIAAVVLIVLSIVVSGLILRRGRVRKPWGTTWTAVIIAAIIDLPLIVAYFAIARATDGLPFPLIAIIGTVVVGILVWLWMTWAHRGPAVETVRVVEAEPANPSIDVKRD